MTAYLKTEARLFMKRQSDGKKMVKRFRLCLSGHGRFDGLRGLSPAVTDTSLLGEQLKPVCSDGLTIPLTELTITLTTG